nr:VWA domain-containing protein [Armatimonadota bacterium]
PVPSGSTNAVVTDAEKISPPITPEGTRAGHDISLSVNLDAGVPLGPITSALHPVDITRKGDTAAAIKLKNANTIPNKDFILRYNVASAGIKSGVIAYSKGEGSGFFTLILQPPAAPPPAQISPKEMIFVIDQTGSQHGWPIAKAKETMKYCMSHLNPGDTFQLLGFNTDLFPCFPNPVPATADNIAKAQSFLAPIEGNGGTDILKSVEYALKLPKDPARPRIICYMTDGYVGNDMQIIDCVKKNRGDARMFPFGVGNSVNRFLIDGMAREGRGVAEYVTLDESGEVAAERFYKRVAQPLLLDVSVDWNGLPVREVYPKAIPDVFTASPIILKGRYSGPAEGDITVHGLLRGKPWQEQVHVHLPEVQDEGSGLQSLWAREKIDDLQEQDWMGAQSGKPDPKIKDAIVEVALENRLMSQWTSFVAVEQRVVNLGGKVRTLDVPVEMPEGVSYGGIFGNPMITSSTQAGVFYARPSAGPMLMLPPVAGVAFGAGPVIVAGAGGFGGGAGYPGGGGAPTAALKASNGYSSGVDRDGALLDESVLSDSPAGQKRLETMKPEDRLALLQKLKLDAKLQGLAAAVKKEGVGGTLHKTGLPDVDKGRVEVQIWLNELPADGLARLKALGFNLELALQPGKLLVGTVSVDQLDALIALPFVRHIEPPRFH